MRRGNEGKAHLHKQRARAEQSEKKKISRIVFSARTHSDLDFHSCCTVCRIILCSAVGTLCNIFYFKWEENLNIKKLKVARYLILPLNCLLEPSPLPNKVNSAGERAKLALAESSKENFSLFCENLYHLSFVFSLGCSVCSPEIGVSQRVCVGAAEKI